MKRDYEDMWEYQLAIPDCCKLRTVQEHSCMLLCWGLLHSLKSGIAHECSRACDLHKEFDQKLLDEILHKPGQPEE